MIYEGRYEGKHECRYEGIFEGRSKGFGDSEGDTKEDRKGDTREISNLGNIGFGSKRSASFSVNIQVLFLVLNSYQLK